MKKSNAAYLAGLFDGEGCITYKQKMKQRRPVEKAYPTWDIRMEINMTHQSVIRLIHEMTGVGTVSKKPPGKVHPQDLVGCCLEGLTKDHGRPGDGLGLLTRRHT